MDREMKRRDFVKLAGLSVATVGATGMLAGCATGKETADEADDAKTDETTAETVDAPQEDGAADSEEKLYIVDTFSPKPGDGKKFLDDYMSTYAPMAQGAGMKLVRTTVAPPMWLDDDSNIIQVVWTLDDIAQQAWAMISATRYIPEYVEWNLAVRDRVLSRDRSYYASEEYMEVLNNV